MRRVFLLVVLVVAAGLVASCSWSSGVYVQRCPQWAGEYVVGIACEVQVGYNDELGGAWMDLSGWDVLRLSFVGRGVVNEAEGVAFFSEDGAAIDPEEAIFQGVYFAVVEEGEARFSLRDADGSHTAAVAIDYVKALEEEGGKDNGY
jgi:hypothetical protein